MKDKFIIYTLLGFTIVFQGIQIYYENSIFLYLQILCLALLMVFVVYKKMKTKEM